MTRFLTGKMGQRLVRHRALAWTLLLVIGLIPLRLSLVPPTIFFEGDDAALCTGIARQSIAADIGPYFFHPRPVPVADPAGGVAALHAQREPTGTRFYRYDTMPGMYFLGYITRHVASPATRMAWLCFLAGTLSPLLFALFLVRIFQPSTAAALPLCYAAIATSPEQWVSGSAYINDKIVASCCIAAALYVVALPAHRKQGLALVLLGGVLAGLGVLMRFDTIVFLPAALFIVWTGSGSLRSAMPKGAALLAAAAAMYAIVCAYMHAPLPMGALGGTELSFRNTQWLRSIVLSAFGPVRLLVFLTSAGLVAFSEYLRWTARGESRQSARALYVPLAAAIALVVPELMILWILPAKSQKYVLIASSVVSGVGAIVPLMIWERFIARGAQPYRAALAIGAAVSGLMVVDASLKLGVAGSGTDGLRFIGGHFRLPVQERQDSVEARSLFAALAREPEGFAGEIVVVGPTWLMEEAIAYHAVTHGWRNTIVPTSTRAGGAVAPTEPAYVTLNRYARPQSATVSVLVPSDATSLDLDALRPVAEAGGRPAYFLKPGQPLSPFPARRTD